LPAVGQGALAIECRGDDVELLGELGKLTHEETWKAVHAERAFLHAMDGGCQVRLPVCNYRKRRRSIYRFGCFTRC
ncbi:hypothetical protein JQK62_24360, partial [Leptospira santarosai]|nr:hypothetical protein [Leptospira santarosai]